MRTFCLSANLGKMFVLFFTVSSLGCIRSFAQTEDDAPEVGIQATSPIAIINQATNTFRASPFAKSGVFTVFRHDNTNLALNVYYRIGGSASNGVDYAQISNWVTIPAGATSNTISILPLTNSLASNVIKTVVLQLVPSSATNPVNYEIDDPSKAVVYIVSTNLPPPPLVGIGIDSPTNGSKFYTPANVPISAWDISSAATTNVEFYAGTNDLGSGIPLIGNVLGVNYQQVWTNPPTGQYALTAVATANNTSITSTPVNITVVQGSPTNSPPCVRFIIPTNGAVFYVSLATNVSTDIELLAKASNLDDSVTNVEFFAGTNDLGPGSLMMRDPLGLSGHVYSIYWRNPTLGNYALTAVATDDGGVSATSAVVSVSIQPTPPPVTNSPPCVRIISPAEGSVFRAPINLPLFAYFNGYPHGQFDWSSVAFYDGTNFLGLAHPVPMPPTAVSTNIYELVWTNVPVGHHVLVAQAEFGNLLNSAVRRIFSVPVKINILRPLHPKKNRLSFVSIVATDPVAVAGTNSWVWHGETNDVPTWSEWPEAACRCFTNYGPQAATFRVRRHGGTSNDVTVFYHIGGTASNGVDYVSLPGNVTIPAGSRRALITIMPIDNVSSNIHKTVILTLDPATNTPPDYAIGHPNRAAALIVDGSKPRPFSGLLPDKCFHLTMPGPDAAWFCLQYSTDLVHWTSLCTNQVVHGSIDFIDPDAAKSSTRFYRAVPLNTAPAN